MELLSSIPEIHPPSLLILERFHNTKNISDRAIFEKSVSSEKEGVEEMVSIDVDRLNFFRC